MFFPKEQERRASACATGARKDIMAEFKFNIELAITEFVKGRFTTTAGGLSSAWSFYHPPSNSVHYNQEVLSNFVAADRVFSQPNGLTLCWGVF